MANQLKMTAQQTIVALTQRGWPQRRIADELGVNREMVARYVRTARSAAAKPAISIAGSEGAVADPPVSGSAISITESEALTPAAAEPNPAISMTGSGGVLPPIDEPAVLRHGLSPPPVGRRSRREPLRAVILAKLEQGLTAQRVWQDLTANHGFVGSYRSVLRQTHPKAISVPKAAARRARTQPCRALWAERQCSRVNPPRCL